MRNKLFYLMFLFSFLLMGCKKDPITTKQTTPWIDFNTKINEPFLKNKPIYNSYTDGTNIYFQGKDGVVVLDKDWNVVKKVAFSYPYDTLYKYPLNNKFCFNVCGDTIEIKDYSGGSVIIDLEKYNTDFNFNFPVWNPEIDRSDIAFLINNNDVLFIPYIIPAGGERFLLIKLTSSPLDTLWVKKCDLPIQTIGIIRCLISKENRFIISSYDYPNCFTINEDGIIQNIINESSDRFFIFRDTLFADFSNKIMYSSDLGINWSIYFQGQESITNKAKLFQINNELIIAWTSLIGWEHLSMEQYKHDGLVFGDFKSPDLINNQITSITQFCDSVYITTNTGIYVKSLSKFFEIASTNE